MNILVTGGTGGLGRATVELLASNKENIVYFTYCSSDAKAQEITDLYSNTISYKCNQTKSEDVEQLVSEMSTWDLDVLINNAWAGSPEGIRFQKLTTQQFAAAFQNNVLPIVSITQAALATFKKKKSGRIITVLTSSLVGVPPLGYGLYGSIKASVAQLAKTWAKEFIKFGITSNTISPEFMATDFTKDTDSRVVEQMESDHPLKSLLQPQDAAKVIAFLVDAPKHINGVDIPVNTGTQI